MSPFSDHGPTMFDGATPKSPFVSLILRPTRALKSPNSQALFDVTSQNHAVFFSDFLHEVVHQENLKCDVLRFLAKIQNWPFLPKWPIFVHLSQTLL